MSNYLSNAEATQLLAEAIAINRLSKSTTQNTSVQTRFRQIRTQLQDYTHSINYNALAIEKIPLEVRRCFVKAVMLLTRYPQLGGRQTGGTYQSSIVSSYRWDSIPHFWYETSMVSKLCQYFKLSSQYTEEITRLLTQVDREIVRQQQIIEALLDEFNGVTNTEEVLKSFQSLFGNIPLPKASIACLTTKMQIAFVIDYHQHSLRDRNLWLNLSTSERQTISSFLKKISQFSWRQFANFPSFGYIELQNIDSKLIDRLIAKTGYSKTEIVNAIASSVTIIATDKAESFLLHDIWGHYWQYILTALKDEYYYLSTFHRELDIYTSIKTIQGSISFRQLFHLKNNAIQIKESKAKDFFDAITKKRLDCLTTHLIGEMLADINEYKWLSQNPDSQELLLSSSTFPNSPTKLDLTIKDLDFLYPPLFENLIILSLSSLESDLIEQFEIKDDTILLSLSKAISHINHLFSQYTQQYKQEYSKLILNLLRLQNLLNKLYTKTNTKDLPFQDLIILFVGNYCSSIKDRDISCLNIALANYFFPCWLLLENVSN